MKAVILVGGEGTRLRPLTCNTPKAMVPILNQPFLEHLLRYLKEHGISDAILAMGYLPDPIQSRLGDGSHFGVQISYLVEESPLGTAGAVKNAESFLDEPFIVFNGDVLTEIDLTDMIKRHREINPEVTMALTPVDNPTIYGVVETTATGMVKRFVEKPTWDKVTTNMINAGIYILEPGVLEYIPTSAPCMFEDHVFPKMLKMGKPILSYPSDAYWIDIGTPEKYLKAHHDLLLRWSDRAVRTQGESQIHTTALIEGPVLIGEGCLIAENVQIKGPTVLGPRCQIAASVVMEGVVLWEGTQVEEKTVLRNCVIGSCTHIGSSCQILDDCVLGDDVTVGEESKLASGTRLWPNNYVDPGMLQST
ncbi:MAG: NDP-sugar synthase [Dehalococcoidia bacterium]|nr:NDP-sugar synthase [Dehalococcoidia bacterium]